MVNFSLITTMGQAGMNLWPLIIIIIIIIIIIPMFTGLRARAYQFIACLTFPRLHTIGRDARIRFPASALNTLLRHGNEKNKNVSHYAFYIVWNIPVFKNRKAPSQVIRRWQRVLFQISTGISYTRLIGLRVQFLTIFIYGTAAEPVIES